LSTTGCGSHCFLPPLPRSLHYLPLHSPPSSTQHPAFTTAVALLHVLTHRHVHLTTTSSTSIDYRYHCTSQCQCHTLPTRPRTSDTTTHAAGHVTNFWRYGTSPPPRMAAVRAGVVYLDTRYGAVAWWCSGQ